MRLRIKKKKKAGLDASTHRPSFSAAPLSVMVFTKIPSFSRPWSAPTPIPMMLMPRPLSPEWTENKRIKNKLRLNNKKAQCRHKQMTLKTNGTCKPFVRRRVELNSCFGDGTHFIFTFLDLHRKHIHLFNPLLQLVLGRRCNRVHVVVASIILLVWEGAEHLRWPNTKLQYSTLRRLKEAAQRKWKWQQHSTRLLPELQAFMFGRHNEGYRPFIRQQRRDKNTLCRPLREKMRR